MRTKVCKILEEVLTSLDSGGEQSRAFAPEIRKLREVLGMIQPSDPLADRCEPMAVAAAKLSRLADESKGVLMSLPDLPPSRWFDGTYERMCQELGFDEYSLSELLRFIADVGIHHNR